MGGWAGRGTKLTPKSVLVPACAFCAAAPLAVGPLAGIASGLTVLSWPYHLALVVLAPLNLLVLWIGYRVHHRRVLPLILGGAGIALVLVHVAEHIAEGAQLDRRVELASPIWLGVALFIGAALMDARFLRATREGASCNSTEYWKSVLTGTNPSLRAGRRFYRALPATSRCKLCAAPLVGGTARAVRLLGKSPSPMNPSFCGDCLLTAPLGGAEVETSVLFVDLRGSTRLAERIAPAEFADAMNRFYRAATTVVVRTDGLVDKLVGDEVVALYLPGFAGERHAEAAVRAAREIQSALVELSLPGGVAVNTGVAFVGMVGADPTARDLTALGDVVNTAARLVSMAEPGELIVSESTAVAAGLGAEGARREIAVRGREASVAIRVLASG